MRKFCALLLLVCAGAANASSFGIIPQVGLAGYGATVQWGFSPYLGLSAGMTGGDFSVRDIKTDEATYDGEVRLRNPQIMLNWAPFAGSFRISAGVMAAKSSFDFSTDSIVNEPLITKANATADFNKKFAPAVSMGFETPLTQTGLGYHFSVGAIYTGEADVKVTASCVSPLPQAACDVFTLSERQKLEDEVRDYRVLPILQAGLLFRM